jgi:hypothetical protein
VHALLVAAIDGAETLNPCLVRIGQAMRPWMLAVGVAKYLWTIDAAEDRPGSRRLRYLGDVAGLVGSCPSRRWECPGHLQCNKTEEVRQVENLRAVVVAPTDSAPPGAAKVHNALEMRPWDTSDFGEI